MNSPQPDPATAESQEQDSDFAEEHDEPSLADEHTNSPGMKPDEATPRGLSGMDDA
jgi:hypothetical protein